VRGTLDLIEATNTCASADAQQSFFPARGARSLRSMCCRKYARRIVELEHEQETSRTEEKFDVASEAYELLEETFGSGHGEYLRATTREYGVALFEQMIMASQIPRDHAIALIRRMTSLQKSRANHRSSAEVDSISRTLLQASVPDKQCCGRNNAYAHMLNSVAQISSQLDHSVRVAFEFRCFEHLSRTSMPLCWLGTRRLTALWANTFRVFFETENTAGSADVARFLHTIVSLDCGLHLPSQSIADIMESSIIPDYHGNNVGCPKCPKPFQPASFLNLPKSQQPHSATNNHASRKRMLSTLNNSFSSLFAILASIVIAARDGSDHVQLLLGSLSMDIIKAVDSLNDPSDASTSVRNVSILAATLLVSLDPRSGLATAGEMNISDLVRVMEILDCRGRLSKGADESPLASLPEFVFATTQSIAKIQGKESWNVLESLSAAMTSEPPGVQYNPSTRAFLIELAISSTEMFSERTDCIQASDLASKLRRTHQSGQPHDHAVPSSFKPTPRPDRARDGLSWEDGLGEWIEAAPAYSQSTKWSGRDHHGFRHEAREPAKFTRIKDSRVALNVVFLGSDELDRDYSHLEQISSSPAQPEQHDSGISGLLLSPISPYIPNETSNEPVRPKKGKLFHQHDGLPPRPINPAEVVSLSTIGQLPAHQKLKITPQKRASRDAGESESDDELGISRPRKKHHRVSNGNGLHPRVHGIGNSGDENEPLDELNLHESDTSSGVLRGSSSQISTARRRPRGNVLRSLSGRHAVTRRPHKGGQSKSAHWDSRDELHDILT
jgi:hypothetical protein